MKTTILKNSELSRDRLIDRVLDWFNNGETSDEEINDVADDIIGTVTDNLPGSLVWMPYTSEIYADIDDNTEISIEEFNEILNKAFTYCVEKRNRIKLLEAMHLVMRHMNNENAYHYWVTMAVPDEPHEYDFIDIAEDDESYQESINTFEKCMKNWIKDGIVK